MSDSKFNKVKYNNEYNKKSYTRFNISLKPAEADEIKAEASAEGLSIAQYFLKCHNEHIHKSE